MKGAGVSIGEYLLGLCQVLHDAYRVNEGVKSATASLYGARGLVGGEATTDVSLRRTEIHHAGADLAVLCESSMAWG